MTIYLYISIFVILLASFVLLETKKIKIDRNNIFIFLSTLLISFSSLRWKVGGDWETYLFVYERATYNYPQFQWSLTFEFLNSFVSLIGGGIYGVNLIIASAFFFSLYRLGKVLKFDIILLLLIAFSLVYFNGIMGYVRQTLCLTFIILSTEFLFRKRNYLSTLFFILSVTTHISAIIFMPIYLFIHLKNIRNVLFILFISIILIFFYNHLLFVAYEQFVRLGRISAGAIYRAIPLVICCVVYYKYRKKFLSSSRNFNFLLDYQFFLSVLMIFVGFIIPQFSTVSDRLSFYLIIFQIIVCGNFFSKVIQRKNNKYFHGIIFVSVSYFIITFAWLIFGNYSIFWLDYNFLHIK